MENADKENAGVENAAESKTENSEANSQMPDHTRPPEFPGNMGSMNGSQMPGDTMPPGFPENAGGMAGSPPEGMPQDAATPPDGITQDAAAAPPNEITQDAAAAPSNEITQDAAAAPSNEITQEATADQDAASEPANGMPQETMADPPNEMPRNSPGGAPGQMAMGSDDVLLKYIDDELDSYSNIFGNAKTDIADSDKERLISSLKKLSNGEDLENTVDIEAVIRYFVVHNFVLNFDSYTGGMIHNYYLYEEDGRMEMIPWDYNLAFGGFESAGGAKSLANYPIDSPVSGGSAEDRPMLSWIFADEEYAGLYHQYFAEFISDYFDSGKFAEMMDSVKAMISPYVEDDPTKFCTFEEFTTGIDTLKEFCLLRAQSIQGQLDGTIGSTSETQDENTLVDTGDIEISDMGSMNMGMMNPMGGSMENPADNRTENEPGLPPGTKNDMPTPDESGSGQPATP